MSHESEAKGMIRLASYYISTRTTRTIHSLLENAPTLPRNRGHLPKMASSPALPGRDFASMNEDDWRDQAQEDENELQRMLDSTIDGPSLGFSLELGGVGGDQAKADDAIDFEDISDDDLPEDEENVAGQLLQTHQESTQLTDRVPGLTDDENIRNDTSFDLDVDLFGGPISELGGDDDDVAVAPPSPVRDDAFATDDVRPGSSKSEGPVHEDGQAQSLTINELMELNFPSNQDAQIPDTFDSLDDFLRAKFPSWDRGRVIKWNELFPTKPASMNTRKPVKPPKPLKITKLTLELDADQQNLFRVPGTAEPAPRDKWRETESRGLVPCFPIEDEDAGDTFSFSDSRDEELVAGRSLQDFEVACTDWDEEIDPPDNTPQLTVDDGQSVTESEDWDRDILFDTEPPTKKRKIYDMGLPRLNIYVTPPNFDNFESVTARNGKRVVLDLNDPHLLIDDADQISKKPKYAPKQRRMADGKLAPDRVARYNFSNDEAYLALKENHQNKVRATLGNMTVEHSLPALKLIWPYYEARLHLEKLYFEDLHRPVFGPRHALRMPLRWVGRVKKSKKHAKNARIQEVYRTSHDMTLNDNSTVVLFEACEQQPPTMSKFGMGHRVANYYRKRGEEEGSEVRKREKNEIGETSILLPEDRSPFSIFGTVDPDETVPTIQNQMYRAPIFRHEPRKTDFMLGRTTTKATGSTYYMRLVEHLYTVGQTFPSTEVPGPHSRKITTIARNRMKMIAYRKMRKSPSHTVGLQEITGHIKESTDQQNRQKLKEFLSYDKGEKQWGLRKGEMLMEEANIRAMIKPEDVCMADSMHRGLAFLNEEDINRNMNRNNEEEEEEGGADEKKEESINSKLAPWKISKAFIDACAGKAMVELQGVGDPTGHGLGFSFIRTSMKGGYIEAVQGPNATTQDAIERERKANGGHSYNVKKQEEMYTRHIRKIWSRQKETLSDPTVHEDTDILQVADEDDRFNPEAAAAATPAVAATPMAINDGMSGISRTTGASRALKEHEAIRIERRRFNKETGEYETSMTVINDPEVAKMYQKRRKQREAAKIESVTDLAGTTALLGVERLTNLLRSVFIRQSQQEMPNTTGNNKCCMF